MTINTANMASLTSASKSSLTTGAGRFAPSPSGDLHVGNLRTAMLAWILARQSGRAFYLRVEDIDRARSSRDAAERQIQDLASLGIEWDSDPTYQQDHDAAYIEVLQTLEKRGLIYECYCSRKDIQQAASAPHGPPGTYPGTCRELSAVQREQKRQRLVDEGRQPALRLRTDSHFFTVRDRLWGDYTGVVDDMIIRRGGQAETPQQCDWAYNFAVVVDDAAAGIDQVVRADDLLASAPRQAYLAHLLGYDPVDYVHPPLVVTAEGRRLAKRDGAVTLRQLREDGVNDIGVLQWIGRSLGVENADSAEELCERFKLEDLSREPWEWTPLV